MSTTLSLLDSELIKLHHLTKFDSPQYFPLYLTEIFSDLQPRVPNQSSKVGITLRVFLNYFNVQAYIGEKLFNSIDTDNDGLITKSEFIKAFTALYQGDSKEVSELVFGLLDFNKDNKVIKKHIELILAYIPTKANNANDQLKVIDESIKELNAHFTSDSNSMGEYLKLIEENHCAHVIRLLSYLFEVMPFTLEEVNMCKNKKKRTAMKQSNSKTGIMPSTMRSSEKKSTAFDLNKDENFTLKMIMNGNGNAKDEEDISPRVSHKKKASLALMSNMLTSSTIEQAGSKSPLKTRAKSKMATTKPFFELASSASPSTTVKAQFRPMKRQSNCEVSRCLIDSQLKPSPPLQKHPKTLKAERLDMPSSDEITDFVLCEGEEAQMEDWLYKYDENLKLNNFKKYYVAFIGKTLFFFTTASKTELLFIINLSGSFIKANDCTCINKTSYYPITINYNLTKHNEKTLFFVMESTRGNWLKRLKEAIGNADIAESYSLLNVIGQGRFGVVHKATRTGSKEAVAVKVFDKLTMKEKDYELIMNEISTMRLIIHPSVVKFFGHFESEAKICIVMELLEGGDLISLLHEKNEKNTVLTEKEAARIMKIIASGIQYLTRFGMIHRDLKPENIIVGKKGDVNSVKLIDFSLTKTLAYGDTLTDSMGTITYVAPELLSKKPYNHKADIWSIGIILYFLLGGFLPFDDDKLDESVIVKKIVYSDQEYPKAYFSSRSNGSIALIDKCLEKNPTKRITINDFIDDNWLKSYGN